jgi:two-component sensor histidine kinase
VLQVIDDGVGFPEGLDFRKTETLGMQIISTLVEQIDGRLELKREKGSAFRLEFNELPRRKIS